MRDFIEDLWDGNEIEISSTGAFSILSIIYLINLNNLNHELSGISNPFVIMGYQNGSPFVFLLGAFLFLGLGFYLIYYLIFKSRSNNLLLRVVFSLTTFVLNIFIVAFINHPILWAAFTVVVVVIGGAIYFGGQQ